MKERNSVWEVCYTVPSSLSFVLQLLRCLFAVVSQGLSANFLEILLHPLILILVDSCSLPSKQDTKQAVRAQLPGKLWCCLGWNRGLRAHCGYLVLWRCVCRSGIKGNNWQIGPSLGAFCLHLSSFCKEAAVHVFLISLLNKKRKVVCQELLSCFW